MHRVGRKGCREMGNVGLYTGFPLGDDENVLKLSVVMLVLIFILLTTGLYALTG